MGEEKTVTQLNEWQMKIKVNIQMIRQPNRQTNIQTKKEKRIKNIMNGVWGTFRPMSAFMPT